MRKIFNDAVVEFMANSTIERVDRTIKTIKEVADIVGISDDVIEDFDKEFNNLVNAAEVSEEWFDKMEAFEASILATLKRRGS